MGLLTLGLKVKRHWTHPVDKEELRKASRSAGWIWEVRLKDGGHRDKVQNNRASVLESRGSYMHRRQSGRSV